MSKFVEHIYQVVVPLKSKIKMIDNEYDFGVDEEYHKFREINCCDLFEIQSTVTVSNTS